MSRRRLGRELALRVLFADPDEAADGVAAVAHAAEEMAAGPAARRFAEELVAGVVRSRAELDRRLAAASDNWALDQMGQVERTILRMAAFEMGPGGTTPVGVAINEAVELAKAYAGGDAARFINGVLGRLALMTAGAPPGPPR
ncbi:MAG TPA: transcription antitermination factor NusB [Verrucomicrobiae bacterium]|nr:transcription antitermination factor NusB [Verrucomicrobiae bacterium]